VTLSWFSPHTCLPFANLINSSHHQEKLFCKPQPTEMQKNLSNLKTTLFLLALSVFLDAAPQSPNQISISIKGIEYDDPGFNLLKESFQKNKKITAFKQSFDQ